MLRIAFQELFGALRSALLKLGIEPERASVCARLFAETTCDGVYSHGLNRFSLFVRTRRENLELGIPVEQSAWDELRSFSGEA